MAASDYSFASDNTAGICPEALDAITAANAGFEPSYGDDAVTGEARRLVAEIFETECDVFFVFNGTAANSLALAACCGRPHTRIICHADAHIETDECGAPEFFTGGAKLTPVAGTGAKLAPESVRAAIALGAGVHFPKPAALSLTQSTEHGTVYTPDEIRALAAIARAHEMAVHVDGARFANAAATLRERGFSPADCTWKAGVDVLSFGGTKNGLLASEAVVFFNRELAREFDYRIKQSGQLSSKMRFAAAQWTGMLREQAWLRHAAHANALARRLGSALAKLPGLSLLHPVEANGVFVKMPPAIHTALERRGWHFHRFIGRDGYRLMCSWASHESTVERFIVDATQCATASDA